MCDCRDTKRDVVDTAVCRPEERVLLRIRSGERCEVDRSGISGTRDRNVRVPHGVDAMSRERTRDGHRPA
jgi:hypothetical protein